MSLLLGLPREILVHHIFCFFDAHSVAPLRETCRLLRDLVEGVRDFRLHIMRVARPWDIPYVRLHYEWAEMNPEAQEHLHELGYAGEAQVYGYDAHLQRGVLLNDFYAQGFVHEHWDEFVQRLREDEEWDFRWILWEFPTLTGIDRYWINALDTVHRGSCLWVSFLPNPTRAPKKRRVSQSAPLRGADWEK